MGIETGRKPLLERLGKEWLFFDGGTGTILQEKGLKGGELPETWNLLRPQDIIDLHCGYLEAGCDIFNTNTFGANALKFPGSKLTEGLFFTEKSADSQDAGQAPLSGQNAGQEPVPGQTAEKEPVDGQRAGKEPADGQAAGQAPTPVRTAGQASVPGRTAGKEPADGRIAGQEPLPGQAMGQMPAPGTAEEVHPDLKRIVEAAVRLAKEARRRSRREDAYIALDIGPTGRLLEPLGDLGFEEAVELFGEVVRIGAAAGADLVLIETMSDSYETKAAVLAAKENCALPVLVTNVYDKNGRLLTGGTVESTVAMLEGLGVEGLGVNCGLGPEQMIPIVRQLTQSASVPILVNPNAGLPRAENGRTVYDVDPESFASWMKKIAAMGVQAVGGCCGTTPEHIKRTVQAVRGTGAASKAQGAAESHPSGAGVPFLPGSGEAFKAPEAAPSLPEEAGVPFLPNTVKNRTVVSSGSQAVEIGKRPVIIGERINPTGKKKFKQALRENDLDYILDEGISQEESGAHILDVNVGLPEIDETKMMGDVVTRLQEIIGLPLQIDTSDPSALERGMRLYNGKPMVNSVNGKKESIEAVFPLVKKYGGVVVGLVLDEDGIPETAQGRLAVAKKIYDAADRYGVPRKDVVIDALAMTISSDTKGALTTLETLRRVRDELCGNTILGVSNISFGLPQRQLINAHFLTMALQSGLSCAIMNPGNADMMAAYRAFLALSDMDPQCMDYIGAYANARNIPAAPAASMPGALAAAEGAAEGKLPSLKGKGADAGGESASDAGTKGTGTKSADIKSAGTKSADIKSAGTKSADKKTGKDPDGDQDGSIEGENAIPTPLKAAAVALRDAVLRGMAKNAAAAAAALLAGGVPALELIDNELIPALDIVGKGFEKGTVFLPQLLMSAEAAQAAFEAVKEAMQGEKHEPKGRIILATVKGDIHDIGKNIVKVMLENYGYDILDLGKDVAPEAIVEAAKREDIRLVGLSALMTTTVVSMEETIRQLREAKPGTKVVVGGAVMTKEYADSIGADCYAPDAMATVHYAEKIFCREG